MSKDLSLEERRSILNVNIGTEISPLEIEPIINNGLFRGYSYRVPVTSTTNQQSMLLDKPIHIHERSPLIEMVSSIIDRESQDILSLNRISLSDDVLSDKNNLDEYRPSPIMLRDDIIEPGLYNWKSAKNLPLNDTRYQYTKISWGHYVKIPGTNFLCLHGTVYDRTTMYYEEDPDKESILMSVYTKEYDMGVLTRSSYYLRDYTVGLKIIYAVNYKYGYIDHIETSNNKITKWDLSSDTGYYTNELSENMISKYQIINPYIRGGIEITYDRGNGRLGVGYATNDRYIDRNEYYRGNFEEDLRVMNIVNEYIPIEGIVKIIKSYVLNSEPLIYVKRILEDISPTISNRVTRSKINKELITINSILN